jgi:hypothetical protein
LLGVPAPGVPPPRPNPPRPPPPPPNPVVHVPEGPGGVIAIEVAWTPPDESMGPFARRHSPVRRSVEDAGKVLVTVATVGTVIVWLPEPAVITVIEMPSALVTSPLTTGSGGCPG